VATREADDVAALKPEPDARSLVSPEALRRPDGRAQARRLAERTAVEPAGLLRVPGDVGPSRAEPGTSAAHGARGCVAQGACRQDRVAALMTVLADTYTSPTEDIARPLPGRVAERVDG
jgi:hypothetical protein